ncbi:mucin-12 [Sciurus carolinensis]|uniref:mucin-12 n=1 Tax=Sciurus carolinensis TaxID=30640 RepID=UPI001FB39233|nr:mucin-12 [Sciurus carolinensis]
MDSLPPQPRVSTHDGSPSQLWSHALVFKTRSTVGPSFTSLHTTSATTSSSSLPPVVCYNGGEWNGKECACPQGYFGYQCQSLLYSFPIEIPEVINATVTVIVKVIHRNFTQDLNNVSSPAYQNFSALFKQQMDKVYMGNDLSEYREVIIRKLLNGSIVVESDVVLEAGYTSEYQTLFSNLKNIVMAKIKNETSVIPTNISKCQDSVLCYNGEATVVDGTVKLGFDPQEQCARGAARGYAQFYYVDELDGRLACVTKCTPGTKSQLNCNLGECQLQHSGPHCLCPNTDTHWYWGETCESSLSKNLVYGIVGAVVAVLLVIMVILTVFLGRSQRKLHRREYDPSREWQREGIPGTFQNSGVWEDRTLREDKFGLENGYSHFRPSLEKVDPAAELHIQKPEVVTTTL